MTTQSAAARPSLIVAMVSLLLFLLTPAQSAQPVEAGPAQPEPSEPAVVVDAFHSALKRGDTTAAAALLNDDAIIYEEGGAELNKAQYVAGHLPGDITFVSVVSERVVRRDGGTSKDYAWVATQGSTTGRYEGRDVDRLTTETMVLRHFASGWRIVHIHWSSRAAPKK